MRRKPLLSISATHRTQHSLFYSGLFSASFSPYILTSYSFSFSFVIYSSDPFLGQSSRALRGQEGLFPECQCVTLPSPPKNTYNPILDNPIPSCQELGMHRAAQSSCSQGGDFCSPFPKAGLSSASSHSPCKPFLHVRGKKLPFGMLFSFAAWAGGCLGNGADTGTEVRQLQDEAWGVRDGPRMGWDVSLQVGSNGWAGLWQRTGLPQHRGTGMDSSGLGWNGVPQRLGNSYIYIISRC